MLKRVVPLLIFSIASLHADDFTVAVIPKAANQEFWNTVRAGAQKATEEEEKSGSHVNMYWDAPAGDDDRERQVQLVENSVSRHVSGILLAPADDNALASPVEAAANANIAVVTIDTPLNSNAVTSSISTDNDQAGRQAADCMGALLKGKGKVLVLRYLENFSQTEARESGFLEELRLRFPKIEVVSSDQHAGRTTDTAYAASQNLLNRFGKEANGVFTPSEEVTSGMHQALKEAGLAGKLKHVGFGSSGPLIEAMRANEIQGLIVQDGFQMGYLGMKTLVHYLQGKQVTRKIDAPVKLVTPANLDDIAIQQMLHPPIQKYSEEPSPVPQ